MLRLKPELRRKLNDARGSGGGGDPAKAAADHGRIRQSQVHIIEHIEKLRPELNLPLLAQREDFIDADIGVPQTRTPQGIDADRAECPERIHGVGLGVEPLLDCLSTAPGCQRMRSHQIGGIEALAAA